MDFGRESRSSFFPSSPPLPLVCSRSSLAFHQLTHFTTWVPWSQLDPPCPRNRAPNNRRPLSNSLLLPRHHLLSLLPSPFRPSRRSKQVLGGRSLLDDAVLRKRDEAFPRRFRRRFEDGSGRTDSSTGEEDG